MGELNKIRQFERGPANVVRHFPEIDNIGIDTIKDYSPIPNIDCLQLMTKQEGNVVDENGAMRPNYIAIFNFPSAAEGQPDDGSDNSEQLNNEDTIPVPHMGIPRINAFKVMKFDYEEACDCLVLLNVDEVNAKIVNNDWKIKTIRIYKNGARQLFEMVIWEATATAANYRGDYMTAYSWPIK